MEKWKEKLLLNSVVVFHTKTRQLKTIWNLMRENSEDNYEFSSANTTAPQNGRDPVNQNLRPIRPGKVVHLKRSTSFIETFPVGPNSDPLSSGNFG